MPGMGFGLGFGFHRRASGSGAFTPESLFAASEAGAWYDPSDLLTLWQDTGGTVPVTDDGDSVARMDDKSGNGNHLTQATASLRPVYKTSGGKDWLLGDGIDDMMTRALADFADIAQPGTIAAAARYNSVTGVVHIIDKGAGGTGRWTIYRNDTDGRFYAGTEATFATVDANDHVYLVEANGASSFARFDGVQSAINPGTESLVGLSIFAWQSGNGHMDGRIYGIVVTGDQLTAGEISSLESYLNGKMP